MKDQQLACLLLITIIASFCYGAHSFEQRKSFHQREANAAKEAALTAQQTFAGAKRSLDQLNRTTEGLRGFLEQWEPHLRSTQSAQATEQRVVDLVKQSGVFTESQRFELLDRRDDTVFSGALRAHIIVKDEYAKTMNWLALLEETLPTSRLSSCVIKRGESGNDIHLSLVIDLPIVPSV